MKKTGSRTAQQHHKIRKTNKKNHKKTTKKPQKKEKKDEKTPPQPRAQQGESHERKDDKAAKTKHSTPTQKTKPEAEQQWVWLLVVKLLFCFGLMWVDQLGSEVWGVKRAPAALEMASGVCRAERDTPQRRDAKSKAWEVWRWLAIRP